MDNNTTYLLIIATHQNPPLGRADIEDDLSCVCGLNKDILDKIESIVLLSSKSTCSNHEQNNFGEFSKVPIGLNEEKSANSTAKPGQTLSDSETKKDPQGKLDGSATAELAPVNSKSETPTPSSEPLNTNPGNGGKVSESQDIMLVIAKLTSEIQHLEAQIQLQSSKPKEDKNNLSQESNSQQGVLPLTTPQTTANSETSKPTISTTSTSTTLSSESSNPTIMTDFLTGLQRVPVNWDNEALIKLNQSQNVKPEDMANALQSTVPNVVSNIFFNIKNLTTQAEQNANNGNNGDKNAEPSSGKLTSIDGSSVSIVGDSSAQITAQGEKLFLLWIEHQIESLHLTASAANYIRKSGLNLFRRIVNQYVDRIQKIGGNVEQNVQKATQMALNNTQTLISYLIRNYMNFAGGLMQIIGEQVSRVGKHLDSTGETIAHISLNPFDIVSNVMESLPNPSEYAKYFRAFGKQLMGEIASYGGGGQTQSSPIELNQQTPGEIKQTTNAESTSTNDHTITATTNNNNNNNNHRPQGLINSLSKTLSSWIG